MLIYRKLFPGFRWCSQVFALYSHRHCFREKKWRAPNHGILYINFIQFLYVSVALKDLGLFLFSSSKAFLRPRTKEAKTRPSAQVDPYSFCFVRKEPQWYRRRTFVVPARFLLTGIFCRNKPTRIPNLTAVAFKSTSRHRLPSRRFRCSTMPYVALLRLSVCPFGWSIHTDSRRGRHRRCVTPGPSFLHSWSAGKRRHNKICKKQ